MRSRFSFLSLFALAFSAASARAQEEEEKRFVLEEARLNSPKPRSYENFGEMVAVSGDTAVVSAPGDASIHVFVNRRDVWRHQARLPDSRFGFAGIFGYNVAISGDIIAATGVNVNDGDLNAIIGGAVYIFERRDDVWRETAYIKASSVNPASRFGPVAVSGNTVIIGASDNESPSGAAHIFTKTAGVWSEQAYLKPSDAAERGFGCSVAISGDTAIVGAVDFSSFSQSGSAYVFRRGPGGWQEQAHLKASGSGGFDGFGLLVGVSGDTLVVTGGMFSPNSGAVHVFALAPGGWEQRARLRSSNWREQDGFGQSVSISGDTMVVGAPFEASDAHGTDRNEPNKRADGSGAAYVFRRRDGQWRHIACLKASKGEPGDRFGSSVGVFGGRVVVGVPREGHMHESNHAAPGAAYVFRVLPPRAELTIVRSPNPFAPTRVGSRSQPQPLLLQNSGSEPLKGLRARALGTAMHDFQIRGRAARTLAPGRTTRVEVIFQPKRTGLRHATLSITGSFGSTRVKLSGGGASRSPRFPRGIE
jgi:hypothetical protein